MDKKELIELLDATNGGDASAINKLVNYYLEINDYKSAFDVAYRFNFMNDPKGLGTLAYFYNNGLGVEQNISKAKELYKRSLDLGELSGGYNLALIYIKEKDYDAALKYLLSGVTSDYIPSIKLLANMYINGDGVVESKDVAINLLNKATALGDKKSHVSLGKIYYANKEYEKAFNEFSFGLNDNDPDSIYYVGLCYAKGLGVKQDFASAFKYYEIGAHLNEPRSLYNLSLYYRNGNIVAQNVDLANKLEEQAIENGFKK